MSNKVAAKEATVAKDVVPKVDCIKTLSELNRETACYWTLLSTVGSTSDTVRLRAELHACRSRAVQLTRTNQAALVPHLRGRIHDRQEIEEYMKLSNDFGCCVELLYDLLRNSLCLLVHFPLDQGARISTGLIEAPSMKSSLSNGTSEHAPAASGAQEYSAIEREIIILTSLLTDIRNMVDIKPWEMEPEVAYTTTESGKSITAGPAITDAKAGTTCLTRFCVVL